MRALTVEQASRESGIDPEDILLAFKRSELGGHWKGIDNPRISLRSFLSFMLRRGLPLSPALQADQSVQKILRRLSIRRV